jgi:hypothetical protein
MVTALVVIVLCSFFIVAGLFKIAYALEDQNEIQKEQIKITKELFIETKANRVTNDKLRLLNEEYMQISLLEKKGLISAINDQITDAVTQKSKPTKATKATKNN